MQPVAFSSPGERRECARLGKGQFRTRRELLLPARKGHFNISCLSLLCLALTAPWPLLLSPQRRLPARASARPRHVLTSFSFPAQTQQSQEGKNPKPSPKHLAPIQTSQRRENRETYFERDLCADVTCRCLSSVCACLSHEMTFEPFLGPFFCLDGRK